MNKPAVPIKCAWWRAWLSHLGATDWLRGVFFVSLINTEQGGAGEPHKSLMPPNPIWSRCSGWHGSATCRKAQIFPLKHPKSEDLRMAGRPLSRPVLSPARAPIRALQSPQHTPWPWGRPHSTKRWRCPNCKRKTEQGGHQEATPSLEGRVLAQCPGSGCLILGALRGIPAAQQLPAIRGGLFVWVVPEYTKLHYQIIVLLLIYSFFVLQVFVHLSN